MSVYCNRWRPRYADLRRADVRAASSAAKKESCVICVHTTCALPPPLPRASLHGVSRYSQLLVDNVADAWPCVTTGGCKCYSSVSCTVPPATLGSGDV